MRGTCRKTTATFSACYYSATIKIPFSPISSMYLLYFTLLRRTLWLQMPSVRHRSESITPDTMGVCSQSNKSLLEGSLPRHFIAKWSGLGQLVTKYCPYPACLHCDFSENPLIALLIHHLTADKDVGSCFGQRSESSEHNRSLSCLRSLFFLSLSTASKPSR